MSWCILTAISAQKCLLNSRISNTPRGIIKIAALSNVNLFIPSPLYAFIA